MRPRCRPTHPSLLIPVLLGGTLMFVIGSAPDLGARRPLEWSPGWVGEHRAVQIVFTPTGLHVRLGWGWPSRYWISQKDWYDSSGRQEIGHECLGFLLGYRGGDFGGAAIRIRWLLLGIPWWFLIALPLAPAFERSERRYRVGRRRRTRRARGLCRACGYDLRASPNRCPECGKITARGIRVINLDKVEDNSASR